MITCLSFGKLLCTRSASQKAYNVRLTFIILGYTDKSFRNAVSSGKIPHYKIFNRNRFKKSELLSLLVKVDIKI